MLTNSRDTKKILDITYYLTIILFAAKQIFDSSKGGSTYDLFEQWMGAGYVFSKLQAYINFDFENIIFFNELNVYDFFGYIFLLPAYVFERFINNLLYDPETNLAIHSFAGYFSSEDAQTFYVLHLALIVYSIICLHIVFNQLKSLVNQKFSTIFIIFLILVPSFNGHALFNIKDIPFLFQLLIAKIYLIKLLSRNQKIYNKREIIQAALLVSFSMLTRINSILFILFLFAYMTFYNIKNLKIYLKNILIILSLSLLFLIVGSPSSWLNPIDWIYQTFMFQSNHPWTGNTLTNGNFIFAQNMTPSYLMLWYFYKMPLYIHFSIILFIIYLIKGKKFNILTNYSAIFVFTTLTLFMFLKPTAYDGLRHFLFLIPFLIIIFTDTILLLEELNLRFFYPLLVSLLIYGIYTQYGLGEQRYTYFNEFTNLENISIECDEVDGCGNWSSDYWGYSGKALSIQLNENYKNENLLICEPVHAFSNYLNLNNYEIIQINEISSVDNFLTLSIHRPRYGTDSCGFYQLNEKVTCKLVFENTKTYREQKVVMSYIRLCSVK